MDRIAVRHMSETPSTNTDRKGKADWTKFQEKGTYKKYL